MKLTLGKSKQIMLLEPRGRQHKNNKTKSNKNKKTKKYCPKEYNNLFYWSREIRMKYNYHCVYCNTSRHLSAHHIFPKAKYKGLKYNLDNGILMCASCHIQLHILNDPITQTQ